MTRSEQKEENQMGRKLSNKWIGILTVIAFIFAAFGYTYIEMRVMEPYVVANSIISDARENGDPTRILDEDEWNRLEKDSKYSLRRETISWDELQTFIQRSEVKGSSTGGPSLLDWLLVFNQREKVVELYTYDESGHENGRISLLMVKRNREWKLGGKLN